VRGLLLVVTYNWKLKLAALALAMLLWVTVSADQPTARWLQVPVEVQIQDPNFELVEPPEPREVRVRFSGTWRDLWDIMAERPPIRAVLTDVVEGRQELLLDPTQVLMPRGRAAVVTALDIRPATVRVELQQVARVDLPVQLVLDDTLRVDLAFADSIRLEPGVVRVSGPAEQVVQLERLRTRPVELPRQSGEFERRVAIDTTGLRNVRLSAEEVVVSGRIDEVVQQTFSDVPVQRPAGLLVVPGVVEVSIRGAESLVRQSAANLRVVVPAETVPAQLPAAGADLAVVVEGVPEGLGVAVQPRTVRVLTAPVPEAPAEPELSPTIPQELPAIQIPGAASPDEADEAPDPE
jgi:YbbR domain-containing protein